MEVLQLFGGGLLKWPDTAKSGGIGEPG
jgi:hypothetical protein